MTCTNSRERNIDSSSLWEEYPSHIMKRACGMEGSIILFAEIQSATLARSQMFVSLSEGCSQATGDHFAYLPWRDLQVPGN